eukprot:TRINITY_DN714_c0_g2_i3.p1 TRINITY_DN714_c0_g2~~TRINITY_DN714_c0_g2_i3.p1  ORF type:complete len:1222 (+),score=357.41 TRINITY_DN714_c0_g2_i3:123-3668(+)
MAGDTEDRKGGDTSKVVPDPANPYEIPWTDFFSMIQDKDLALYHKYGGLEGISRRLQSSLPDGILGTSVESRTSIYGQNFLPPEEEITYLNFLKEALSDKMMLLLLVLGSVALVIGMTVGEGGHEVDRSKGWIDGTFIILAVALVVLATTINDYLKELKFQALNARTSQIPFFVRRDGQRVKIDVSEIVVGDIVEFSSGCAVPCDGLFISGQGVTIDESACTGENDEKKKKVSHSATDTVKQADPFIISGTSVIAAEEGRFLCIGVGENSFSGKLEMQTRTGKAPTPLQEKLDDLADTVGKVGIATAVLLFVTLTVISAAKDKSDWDSDNTKSLLDYAIIGVSIVVVAVPEGLPLSVTIALAYSMSAMLKDNNMVRSLAACETMGAATQICSDKTGTLTTNNMTMVKGHVGGRALRPFPHNQTTPLSLSDVSDVGQAAMDIFLEACAFNTSATQVRKNSADADNDDPDAAVDDDGLVWIGNKTEQGILRFVKRAAHHMGGFQGIRNRLASKEDRFIFPFQSARKSMTTVVREKAHPVHGPAVMQYTKGASEIILEYSSHFLDHTGDIRPMDDEKKSEFTAAISSFAKDGFRVIGIAFRKYGEATDPLPEKDPFEPSKNLVLAGLCAIQDPVRDEVPAAVELCKGAGVMVRMCTGDNIDTAKAIAKQCGIVSPGEDDAAMTGPAFRKLFCDDAEGIVPRGEFRKHLAGLRVLARCSPLDKQLLVGNLMLCGEVVAVTGDGTNDAPALKLADVGFAMNIGTDVAKKASKIVLLDNNFVSVVKACRWGRNVNDNIRKFLQFQFTVNCVLLIITFLGAVVDATKSDGSGDPPLAAVHLLWANLIMDTMAALALSTENPHDSLMKRLPTYRSAPLISRRMWRFILGSSVFQLAVTLTLIFAGEDLFDTKDDLPVPLPVGWTDTDITDFDEKNKRRLRTVIFNVFIYMQVFNWFHARKLYDEVNPFEGFGRSPMFIPIVLFTAAFQAFIVEVAGSFMETESPGGVRWGVSMAIAVCMWPWGCIVRLVPIQEPAVGGDDMTEDGEEGEESSGKFQMIQQVNKENLMLFGGRGAVPVAQMGDPAINVSQGTAERFFRGAAAKAAHRTVTKVRVVRAFRSARGITGRRKSTSSSPPPPAEQQPDLGSPHLALTSQEDGPTSLGLTGATGVHDRDGQELYTKASQEEEKMA